MADQLGFLETGAYNTLQVKLHSRTTDPVSSKRAAAKLESVAIRKSLELFLSKIKGSGLTVQEAARLTLSPDHWNHEWARRVKAWSVAGHIELTGEERNGSRVWRVKE